MNKKKNLISSIVLQILAFLYGLIVPKLILLYFGSEVNGLVSSITQFLGFVALFEGGLGAVVLAEFYKPLHDGDDRAVSKVFFACRKLFYIVGGAYAVFSLVLAIVYGAVVQSFDFFYVFFLTLILSLQTVSQYMFSISGRLLLQADQKIYIVNIVGAVTYVFNILSAILCVKVFPDVHLFKLATGVFYLVQPFIFSAFVKKYYVLDKAVASEPYPLKNRWSGFAQNLAFFINANAGYILVTLFLAFTDVSVYAVYLMPVIALRGIVSMLNNSYQSAFGKYYLDGTDALQKSFNRFSLFNAFLTTVFFMTCLYLITPFVSLYVSDITDADYYQPLFGMVMVFATFVYCLREPFRLVVLAAGKFKETSLGAYIEVGINLLFSLLLIKPLGLTAIAVGTLAAAVYRFGDLMRYLKKDVLFFGYRHYLNVALRLAIVIAVNMAVYPFVTITLNGYFQFFLYGCLIVVAETLLSLLVLVGPKKVISTIKERRVKK